MIPFDLEKHRIWFLQHWGDIPLQEEQKELLSKLILLLRAGPMSTQDINTALGQRDAMKWLLRDRLVRLHFQSYLNVAIENLPEAIRNFRMKSLGISGWIDRCWSLTPLCDEFQDQNAALMEEACKSSYRPS